MRNILWTSQVQYFLAKAVSFYPICKSELYSSTNRPVSILSPSRRLNGIVCVNHLYINYIIVFTSWMSRHVFLLAPLFNLQRCMILLLLLSVVGYHSFGYPPLFIRIPLPRKLGFFTCCTNIILPSAIFSLFAMKSRYLSQNMSLFALCLQHTIQHASSDSAWICYRNSCDWCVK